MKRNSVRLFIALGFALAGLLVFGSKSSTAQSRGGKQWWTSTTARQQLNLTDEQVTRIGELQQAHQERLASIRRTEARALREMVGALDNPSVPPDVVAERRQRLDEAWSNHLQTTIDHWIALRQVLTTEQWRKLPNVAPQALRIGMLRLRERSIVQVPASD